MPASLDDMLELAVFARVVETRSFTAAAARLGLSKSVVSERVSKLEERLGVRLLHRTTRKLGLTEAGAALYPRAARLLAAADEAATGTGDAAEAPAGLLRVTAPLAFSRHHLAKIVARLADEHPGLRIEIDASDRRLDLIEGAFDVAIRIGRLADSTLTAKRLGSDRLVVVASPAWLARHGPIREPADLDGHEVLHYSALSLALEWRFKGRTPQVNSRISSSGGIFAELAAAGAGPSVMPYHEAAPEVAAGRLGLLLEGARREELPVHALHPYARLVPARVRVLIDAVAAHLARPGWQEP